MNRAEAPAGLPDILVPFVTLSYPTDAPAHPDAFPTSKFFSIGLLDGCLIVTCIAVMAILRDVTRVFLMEPFAKWYLTRLFMHESESKKATTNGHSNGHANGYPAEKKNGAPPSALSKRKDRIIHRSVLRFAEQSWSLVYYTVQFAYGLYVHFNLPTAPFNLVRLWEGYPHFPLAGPVKFYYLTQTAFYLHQILILHAEARRKDHYQMLSHHVITIALMVASYFYNFTRVGCLLMVLMDTCDIFLPLAKMLRYLKFPTLCDIMFGVFLLSWLITRHILFILVIVSTFVDVPKVLPYAWIPEEGVWFTRQVYIAFVSMLVSLQVLQVLWFAEIAKIAWLVITGQGADDTRSEDEDEPSQPHTSEEEAPATPTMKKRRR
ncbi:longevity assurance proteins LAG1/LAC1 [Schizopora paradoxa]|uniref:Longevity assurance proteins LAG1/LAC1 n=1 Tax=Schizopora paradoxa TaxID=27342 RepID=A0A0H2SM02_9AGAM|nr:longevity assurance proteins LAG1/LAC1 [Schizopora paradoxa]